MMYRIKSEQIQLMNRRKFKVFPDPDILWVGDRDQIYSRLYRRIFSRIFGLDPASRYIKLTNILRNHYDLNYEELEDHELFDVKVRRMFGHKNLALALIESRGNRLFQSRGNNRRFAYIFFRTRVLFVFRRVRFRSIGFDDARGMNDLKCQIATYFNSEFNMFVRISPLLYPH